MNAEDMKRRTREFGVRVAKLAASFPASRMGNVIGNQLMRSGTSVPANYRAACRARSKAEFVSRLGVVEEEADETVFWMGFAVDVSLVKEELVRALRNEGEEIVKIVVASRKTARK